MAKKKKTLSNSIWTWLKGKKTYTIGFSAVVIGLLGLIAGTFDKTTAMQFVLAGLGAMGLRHGVSED